jgi:hypothetical protein
MAQHTDEPAPEPSEAQPGDDLPLIELETLLSQPPSQRKRLTQLGLLLAAAGIALALFWNTLLPGKAPAPISTRVMPAPSLLILGNVNYGLITINGKQQPGQIPMVIALRANTSYTLDITLNAPPFRSHSCHVRLDQYDFIQSNTQCRTSIATPNEAVNGSINTGGLAFEIDFTLSLDDLPPAQQNAITKTVTQALSYQQAMSVPAGSYFAIGFDQAGKIISQRASAPVQASASVTPSAPPQNSYAGPCVASICAGGFETQTASGPFEKIWNIQVVIAPRWRFIDASGAALGDEPFPAENSVSLLLSYDARGGWTIASGIDNDQLVSAFCNTGENMLGQLTTADNASIGTAYDRGAAGCELVLDVNGVDQGLYLWRFGVLLTVDAKARAAHPELPAAPPDEVAAVVHG